MAKYIIDYHSTCGSSYFQGSSLPVVQVLVDGRISNQEVLEELHDVSGLDENIDYDAYREAVDMYFASCTPEQLLQPWDDTLDEPNGEVEWEEWDCYSYFVIVTLEEEDNG